MMVFSLLFGGEEGELQLELLLKYATRFINSSGFMKAFFCWNAWK
jgi:hypothetical protein